MFNFPRRSRGKHQDSRENKTNCFPQDPTLRGQYCFKICENDNAFCIPTQFPGPPSKKNFPGFQNPEFPYNGMAGLRFSQGPDPVRRENKIAFRFYATFSRSSFCSRSLCAQFCESSSRFILLIFLVLS